MPWCRGGSGMAVHGGSWQPAPHPPTLEAALGSRVSSQLPSLLVYHPAYPTTSHVSHLVSPKVAWCLYPSPPRGPPGLLRPSSTSRVPLVTHSPVGVHTRRGPTGWLEGVI